jgi:polysaccharide biosynthesis transport protein
MSQSRGETTGLADYVGLLRRRKWLLILATVAVPTVAMVFSLTRGAVYEAQADVLLSRQNLASALTGTTDPTLYLDEVRFAQTQAKLAAIPEIARRTLRAAGVADRDPEELLASTSISAAPNVDLLEFRVEDSDRALATRLATEYARQYTDYRSELDTAAISRARREVEARIADLQATGRASPLLQTLLDKQEQLLTLEALQTENAFVVREAGVAEKVSPRPLRDLLLGIALGLALGLAVVLLAEAIDTRVRAPEEVAQGLELPLLGTVPPPSRRLRREPGVALIDEPHSSHAEAFRILRTSVEFANLDAGARTLMITSSVEGEGKSTTAANLAVAFAHAGRHVVIVDLDLRRPMIDELFGLPHGPGLGDVALGSVQLGDALREVPIRARSRISIAGKNDGRIEVLSAGTSPPDPGAFVTSKGVERALQKVAEHAELVLIDAPPLLQVGDALALTAKVDAVLVVARVRLVRRQMLREVTRILRASPAATLGVVVTGVNTSVTYGYAGYRDTKGSRQRRGSFLLDRLRRRAPRTFERGVEDGAVGPTRAKPVARASSDR